MTSSDRAEQIALASRVVRALDRRNRLDEAVGVHAHRLGPAVLTGHLSARRSLATAAPGAACPRPIPPRPSPEQDQTTNTRGPMHHLAPWLGDTLEQTTVIEGADASLLNAGPAAPDTSRRQTPQAAHISPPLTTDYPHSDEPQPF